MAMNTYPIIGVFDNRGLAEQAIEALHNAGFNNDQISYSGGSTGGGFLAGLKSLFTGENEDNSAVVNDLTNIGVPQDQATYYADEHRAGHPVVAVRANGREQEASSILRSIGGYDYSSRQNYANTSYGQTYADRNAANYVDNTDRTAYTDRDAAQTNYVDNTDRTGYADTDTTDQGALRLREERLQAEKQRVQAGEVHLRKDVVEEEKQLNVPVTHEEVYIERRPLEGRASDTPIGQDETIRVPVNAEQVNVTKTPVETGEVAIGKRAVTENQQVSDTVKREEAHLERRGEIPVNDATVERDRYVDPNNDPRV